MTDLGLFALLWLVSEYSHLLGLAVLDDLSCYGSAVNIWSANLDTVVSANYHYLIESNSVLSVYVQLLYENLITRLNLILLSACFNYCVHYECTYL